MPFSHNLTAENVAGVDSILDYLDAATKPPPFAWSRYIHGTRSMYAPDTIHGAEPAPLLYTSDGLDRSYADAAFDHMDDAHLSHNATCWDGDTLRAFWWGA